MSNNSILLAMFNVCPFRPLCANEAFISTMPNIGLTGTRHGIWNKRLVSKCWLSRQNYLPQGVNIALPWVTFVEEVVKQNCSKIKEIDEY